MDYFSSDLCRNNPASYFFIMIPIFISAEFESLKRYEINSKLRLAHFLSQVAHESVNFNHKVENLNYSAEGLMKIFPKYFPDKIKALQYERKPEKIANLVYANRMGNGDESSGDGWKYRGRGYLQLTGKDNYTSLGKFLQVGLLTDPDLVATKYALISAAWFFHVNGINKISDLGVSDAAVAAVTKKVNGGTNGLAERIKLFKEYYSELK